MLELVNMLHEVFLLIGTRKHNIVSRVHSLRVSDLRGRY